MSLSERWRGYGLRSWSRGRRLLVGVTSRVACLAVVMVGALALLPAGAWAEPVCTDTWTGPNEGTWQTAGNWSTGKAPSSTDVACIEAGKTVKVTEGTNSTGVLLDKGILIVKEASLEVANALEVSSVKALTMEYLGTLTGAATLDVSGSFSWAANSTMSGSGSTVLQSGVKGSINSNAGGILAGRTLVNEGAFTFEEGVLTESEGARFENKGTFNANAQGIFGIYEGGGAASTFVNIGIFQKIEGTGETRVEVSFENQGTVNAKTGKLAFRKSGSTVTLTSASVLEGSILFNEVSVAASGFYAPSGTVTLERGTMTIASGDTVKIANFVMNYEGNVTGAGNLDISGSFSWAIESTMSGSGVTVLEPGTSNTISAGADRVYLAGRTLVNEGALNFKEFTVIVESEGAKLENTGTFNANSEPESVFPAIRTKEGSTGLFVNTGVFQKTEGTGTTVIETNFENLGTIHAVTGKFEFKHPVVPEASTQYGGPGSPSTPGHPHSECGDPVSCATGNFSETQTDFAVGGRGVGLNLTRTYNSQAGAEETKGAFGYGWTGSFSDHISFIRFVEVGLPGEFAEFRLYQANGGTITFIDHLAAKTITGPAWTQDVLRAEASHFILTLPNQTQYMFAYSFSSEPNRLESVTDRNGNTTTLAYNEAKQLETITDPTSRKITFAYNAEGLVESAKDPLGHTVKYTYEGGDLKSVTQPAEEGLRWQFKYDGSQELTEMTDGRGGKTVNEYNGSHQVVKQTDPAGHELSFEYEAFHTKITNKTTGSVTDEHFTSYDEPFSITRGFGTTSATTESFTYNVGGYVTSVADGNEHATTYGYNGANDRTSMVDPNKNETKWTYDSTHDVDTMTTPKGETTTIKREARGNPEAIERPAPASKTQITKYKYKTTGELESVEDPLKRVWKYEYDVHGDRTAEVDPLTDKRTWEYNEDSQEIATVSPRGNITGGEPSKFTTKIERDNQGRPLKITDPLTHTTKYTYDGDGNVETVIDGNSHTTKYTYNADNQPTKVEAPNKAITETEYDGAGQVVSQTDGNKNTTKYKRNSVEEVTEVTDPLGRITKKEYDAAGNLKALEDPAKRTTTYKYDPANRLEEVGYSDGVTPTVKYEYDADGDRTKMVDGTGTTKYTYDQLDRLAESENGHKEVVKYEYNLANQQTKITYPSTKSVTRVFDKAGRLEKITDWLSNITKFNYNADSNQTATVFPTGTSNEDKYVYNNADQMTEAKMLKSTETLASLVYTRDNDGQVKKTTAKGLPGAEITENTYDANNRVTKSGSEYKYDSANNPTTIGAGTYQYDKADELETGPSLTYTYNELGERTKTKPTTGPATTYGYDQAGNLISVERPKEGEVSEIKDMYAYDGNGLRASRTISGTTTYLTWDMAQELPLILSDGINSYIYGPGGIPVEQINNTTGTVHYLHHDQQGSTRLITGSAGTVEGKCTYGAYGTPTCEGAATTPLGYDGQYTSTDTGLIYMRARDYDPATAQFLSVDPLVAATETSYGYGAENPLTFSDPTGFFSIPLLGSISEGADAACGVTFEVPGLDAVTCGAAAAATAYLGPKALSETIRLASENSSSTNPEVAEGEPEIEEDASCKLPSRSLPYRGEPNSTQVLDRGNGSGQIRDYGPDGLPEKDFDFGHDHGFGDPHVHDWVDGVRQNPGRSIGPNE
ncbi:MAG TPA: RHS repeat-associated core domain-containing protein [Solirubrobacteraceae bacterium]|nr:RHS repeat-associated core domain-containing protein [Solirubrobacteraceae bacterium]